MKQLLIVGVGGALGAVARWQLGGAVLRHTAEGRFPMGTFVVNVLGCVVAGVLAGLVTKLDWFSADTRLFLFAGVLGGFTTFSAFGVDTLHLVRRQAYGVAAAYVTLSVLCSLLGVAAAYAAVRGDTPNAP